MSHIYTPGFNQGYARNITEAKYPSLWNSLVALWDPAVGRQGMRLLDMSGNRNHADPITLTASSWVSGKRGFAIEYNGTTDYWDTALTWNYDGPVSVSFWNFVVTAVTSAAWGGFGTDRSDDRFMAHAPWVDGNLYWDYGDDSGPGRVSASYAAYLNKWTHVALTSTGAGGDSQDIWFDGELAAHDGTSDGPSGTINFDIGRLDESPGADQFHTGRIGQLAIWRRVLSPQEIQILASNRSPLTRK